MIQAAVDHQKPARIVAAMRRRGIAITPPRDVYNVKQVERARILAVRSPLVALLDGLEERPDAPYFAQFGPQRKLTHLLITSSFRQRNLPPIKRRKNVADRFNVQDQPFWIAFDACCWCHGHAPNIYLCVMFHGWGTCERLPLVVTAH